MTYDYLIVGAGLYGSILYRLLTNSGYNCLVIDKRNHIGGNCYTKNYNGINVHEYGPHIFHTKDKSIYDFILQFTTINSFSCRPKLKYKDSIYSIPINLMTLNQLFGVTSPDEAKKIINTRTKYFKELYPTPKNAYEYGLATVGFELYYIFYDGYLRKQWKRNPKEIPAFILARQQIKYDYNDTYYASGEYQGILDYTCLFNTLLKNANIQLNVDYLKHKQYYDSISSNIIYTGPIDRYYEYKFGKLDYRSLNFEHTKLNTPDFQGVFMVSYPELKYDFTRIIEHKHFEFGKQDFTIITKEYPQDWDITKEAYYPINDVLNNNIYDKYFEYSKKDHHLTIGGRLGLYKYLNMDETIKLAYDKFIELVS